VTLLALRDYQREALVAVEAAWGRGMARPAVQLPTGVGKTVAFAHGAARWLAGVGRGRRVLVCAHRSELIDQAAAKLRSVAPDLRVGIVKASANQTLADVVVASVPTLAGARRRAMISGVGMIVIDECHHATARSYVDILDHYGAFDERAVAVGYTATMVRGDKAALGDVWQDVVYSRSIADMIAAGWLVRPRGTRVRVADLDLGGVKRSRGDYAEASLGDAIESSMAPEAVAKAVREHASGRPTLLFAPLVRTAEVFRDALIAEGFSAAVVSALTPGDERARLLEDFRCRRLQVLCNAMVFTEGTDLPLASCVVIARPTTNAGLYVQMVGRVLRPDVGKVDALVLDVVGASQRHALAAHVQLFGEESVQRAEREDAGTGEDVDELDSDLDTGELEMVSGLGLDLDDPSWRNGPLVSEVVDLFHGSESAWMRTRAGVWFLAAGERYIALIPGERGGYDVVAMHRYQIGSSRWVVRGVEDLSYAMAWAEGDVSGAETMTARRERSWRAQRPSDKQRRLAQRYGIMITEGMHSGEVSARISVEMASARIDSRLPAYALG
jgi:superfamily II DNA or RNA helicase